MVIETALAILLSIAIALSIMGYRRARDEDRPVRLWRREWASAAEAAASLAEATGLVCEQRVVDFSWLRTFLLGPVWLFWGPMTAMEPERRLARWRLVGARPSGRTLRVELTSGCARFSLACKARTPLWTSASHHDVAWPLEEQEGLRLLHPVGSIRWAEGTALIGAAFALGLDRLRVNNGLVLAKVDLDERGPSPGEYPRALDALERLAIWLETDAKR